MRDIRKGRSKADCVRSMSSFIESILSSAIENCNIEGFGPYGFPSDSELLVTMANIALDDAVNSGDVDENARVLVEGNYDRFKASVQTGGSQSVRGKPKSGRSATKPARKPQNRKGVRR